MITLVPSIKPQITALTPQSSFMSPQLTYSHVFQVSQAFLEVLKFCSHILQEPCFLPFQLHFVKHDQHSGRGQLC